MHVDVCELVCMSLSLLYFLKLQIGIVVFSFLSQWPGAVWSSPIITQRRLAHHNAQEAAHTTRVGGPEAPAERNRTEHLISLALTLRE